MIPVLFEVALRALVVALAVGTGLHLLRVRNVLAQKIAWGLVLAASLAMPMLMRWRMLPASAQIRLTMPTWVKLANPTPRANAAPSYVNAAAPSGRNDTRPYTAPISQYPASHEEARGGGDRYPAPVVSSVQFSTPGNVRTSEVESTASARLSRMRPAAVAALAYFSVCAVLLLRLLFGLGAAVDLWLNALPISHGMAAHIAPGLRLRMSEAVFSPVTIGSGVVLPADFAEWDAEKLRIVLAHERSHIRQGDFYLQMLAGLYAAVFWFSPLGWWLKRKLSDLGEAISDRAGVEEAASRASYAQVLLEFAAMPRPTLTGVAMARTTNLSHRIERLLNDTIFHQSFAASRRAVVVGLLFPLMLIAATSMIRVEAAGQAAPPPPAPAPTVAPAPAPPLPAAPLSGVSDPDIAPPPAPQAPIPNPPAAPEMAPMPPLPPVPGPYGEIHDQADEQDKTITNGQTYTVIDNADKSGGHSYSTSVGHGYSYSYSSNGDSWAVVAGPDQDISFTGVWNGGTREAIEKARKQAHGKFLWFTHDGKSYMIDDPALMAQVENMYKPMQELGRQQAELGRQQAKLGQQQSEMSKQQRLVSIPTPDLSREIGQVDAAMAKLKSEKEATVSQEELAEIQGKLAELQGRLGEIQGRIGDRVGLVGEKQGHLGELQGKLGEQQGRLGEQQGRLAREADRKMKSIIDQSLSSGKAKPVE